LYTIVAQNYNLTLEDYSNNMGDYHEEHWRWKPGELVQLKYTYSESHPMYNAERKKMSSRVGIVLRYYDSNMYEPASVDILFGGREINMSTRDLIRLKEKKVESGSNA